jgi:hypothetical protein
MKLKINFLSGRRIFWESDHKPIYRIKYINIKIIDGDLKKLIVINENGYNSII